MTDESQPGPVDGAAPGRPQGLSRRGLLALGGGAGLAAGALAGGLTTAAFTTKTSTVSDTLEYPFYGEHQGGIVTPAQDRMHFAAFDLRDDVTRDDLIELLQDWTYAASRLVMGLDVSAKGAFEGGPYLPPDDTGEASDLGPSGLTLTFGFGRTLFRTDDGVDRFGLAASLPPEFGPLPKMVNDFIDRSRSGGDLCIQACANDPQVAVHAIRNLTRIGFGRSRLRWSQLGFGRTSSTSTAQATPRNLFGQKDGTNNLKAEEPDRLAEHVWIANDPAWAKGGSYLVARRISMTIEVWDGLQLQEQDRVLGREKGTGAPLSGGEEFTAPDFSALDAGGKPVIDQRSHVFRTHPDNNDGVAMLRRGYNFVDGNDDTGRLDAGLFFIAFVKSPDRFTKVHQNMARDDMFVEYLKTTSSSVFLVPPGITTGQYVGQSLFEA
ncbi:MAG: iron uptake transporter deferrochelatase/peroxidase subunit [Propionicimonas sp.]|uniref:iron uptake transporter deferrochelatase/peroxidase subunit n=1 Tax=Propionicimonas sp. TaxID=1955623 RepID=UPI002B20F548|nr:iron uptake transporter deferrochelatase/peroxidase subunit [Propionicimonas sp.]MEA4945472.1 iron uptake transporter deferrochelatase/peroxidase subunit [Propionicimonas sp.]